MTRAREKTVIETARQSKNSSARPFGRLRGIYLRGFGIVPFGLMSCFMTGSAGTLANAYMDAGSTGFSWFVVARHIAIGYVSACGVVLLLLPWAHVLFQKLMHSRRRPVDPAADA